MSIYGADTLQAADVWVKLCRAQMAVSARVFRGLPARTSLAQFAVLEALDYLGPMYQREISEKILKSTGNVTVVVNNLERDGLAVRTRSQEDRRRIVVSITDKGREWIRGILPVYLHTLTREFSALTPDERQQLGDLCRKLGRTPAASSAGEGIRGKGNAEEEGGSV
jgi:MarR family 2-MHQ and catechol resistance regulon transcriptional repressor